MRGAPKPAGWLFASKRGRTLAVGLTVSLALALSSCAPDPQLSTVSLSLKQLPSCMHGGASTLTLDALGDFPTRSTLFDPQSMSATLSFDAFPIDTRQLRASAVFGNLRGKPSATGLVSLLPPFGARSVLLLPEHGSCVIGDPLAVARPGAAVSALPDGSVLIAGGLEPGGLAERSVLVLPAGEQLVQQVAGGMLLRRAYASATTTGELVVIAGGGAEDSGNAQALDTYEIFDALTGKFAVERTASLSGPRMQHAAARLPDGRVLLVGGRATPSGPGLRSAELIDASSGELDVLSGAAAPVVARIAAQLLVLDSATVLVVGGDGEDSVESFDARKRRFTRLAVSLPLHPQRAFAALPGARVAQVGCDNGASSVPAVCTLTLLLQVGASFITLPSNVDFTHALPNGLQELRLLGLPDGRLLLTGRDPSATIEHRALVIDLQTETIEERDATRVPSQLLRTHDGTLVELDTFGASLRREDSDSEYDSPSGDLVSSASRTLVLDAAAHWTREPAGLLAAHADAGLTLASLRFEALRVQLDATGEVVVSLVPDDGSEPLSASLSGSALSVSGCHATLPRSAQLVLERHAASVKLSASNGGALCEATIHTGALHVSLRANKGTLLRSLRVIRL